MIRRNFMCRVAAANKQIHSTTTGYPSCELHAFVNSTALFFRGRSASGWTFSCVIIPEYTLIFFSNSAFSNISNAKPEWFCLSRTTTKRHFGSLWWSRRFFYSDFRTYQWSRATGGIRSQKKKSGDTSVVN